MHTTWSRSWHQYCHPLVMAISLGPPGLIWIQAQKWCLISALGKKRNWSDYTTRISQLHINFFKENSWGSNFLQDTRKMSLKVKKGGKLKKQNAGFLPLVRYWRSSFMLWTPFNPNDEIFWGPAPIAPEWRSSMCNCALDSFSLLQRN